MVEGAYPHPDSQVFDVFVDNPIGETKVEAAARFGAILIALFDCVVQALTLHDRSVSLPQWWREYLLREGLGKGDGSNRERLYKEAVNNHGAFFAQIQSEVTETLAVSRSLLLLIVMDLMRRAFPQGPAT